MALTSFGLQPQVFGSVSRYGILRHWRKIAMDFGFADSRTSSHRQHSQLKNIDSHDYFSNIVGALGLVGAIRPLRLPHVSFVCSTQQQHRHHLQHLAAHTACSFSKLATSSKACCLLRSLLLLPELQHHHHAHATEQTLLQIHGKHR